MINGVMSAPGSVRATYIKIPLNTKGISPQNSKRRHLIEEGRKFKKVKIYKRATQTGASIFLDVEAEIGDDDCIEEDCPGVSCTGISHIINDGLVAQRTADGDDASECPGDTFVLQEAPHSLEASVAPASRLESVIARYEGLCASAPEEASSLEQDEDPEVDGVYLDPFVEDMTRNTAEKMAERLPLVTDPHLWVVHVRVSKRFRVFSRCWMANTLYREMRLTKRFVSYKNGC